MTKIANAEAILVSIPFESGGTPPWSFGGAPRNAFDIMLVRLETEDGIVGWGEAFSRNQDRSLQALIESRILPLVIGREADRIAETKFELEFELHNFGRVGPVMYGISAVEIALWDILGKRCGQPLAALLGGAFAGEVEVYASLMRYGSQELVAEWTKKAIGLGYKNIKLHEVELPVIKAAVQAASGKARVTLDTNCPWSVEEALEYDKALEPLGLDWLEEPVWPPENYKGLARIRQAGRHLIAAGENAGSMYDFVAMIDAGAIDIAQPDVAKTGGIIELQKIAALCETHGVEFVPHCALFGPGQVATIHICAAHRRVPMLERLFCEFEAELYGEYGIPKRAHFVVPTEPGLGRDPDPHVIREYRVTTN
ncbi:MAG: mandelate racemase/muconate lactonizing enzyme family protein [Hyphomicrobiaceae bacterium]|nr:mandelate racemase/muconate lactonizing enzyme family protein [Hyphomicrobiaceae bacterium]